MTPMAALRRCGAINPSARVRGSLSLVLQAVAICLGKSSMLTGASPRPRERAVVWPHRQREADSGAALDVAGANQHGAGRSTVLARYPPTDRERRRWYTTPQTAAAARVETSCGS